MRIVIVGRGRVGRSLARAWTQHEVRLAAHDAKRAPRCEVAVLAVPDRAVAETAAHWAPRLARGTLVLHTAGALDLKPLEAAKQAGHPVGSLHPLLAISSPSTKLSGTFCALDGARPALLRQLARDAGMRPLGAPGDRARYHLGAVLASNFQGPLLEAATAQLVASGVRERDARAALAHLAHSAIDSWLARGGPMGLTGPVARGDAATVEKHLRALPRGPDRELYLALSRAALELASKRRPVPSGLPELARLLSGG